jgi:hypothetical protein
MNPNLNELRRQALTGDTQAIEAIRDHALQAIGILNTLTYPPAGHPDIPDAHRAGVAAAHQVARQSLRWPVSLAAIDLERKQDLARFAALEVGTTAGIRLKENPKGGAPRKFNYNTPTGFALDIFGELDAIRQNPLGHVHIADRHPDIAASGLLPKKLAKRSWRNLAALLEPLSRNSVKRWQAAGVELCREWCGGDWENFPWPACVWPRVGRMIDENGGISTAKSAVTEKILSGLNSLIR